MIHVLHVAEIALVLFVASAGVSMRLKWTKDADLERFVFSVFGLSFAFSRYDPDNFEALLGGPHDNAIVAGVWTPRKLARPFSGAALGIAWSSWIYTRRHAYGRAMVRDWALSAYLQINVADILVTAESGSFIINPAKRYLAGERIMVGVVNRNPCVARGLVVAWVLNEHDNGDVLGAFRMNMARHFVVKPSEVQYVKVDEVGEHSEIVVERIEYITEPTGDFRVGRLHGRPEWEA